MTDKQEDKLKEMCIIMINLLGKLRSRGEISDAEYSEQIQMKKQFLDYLEHKAKFNKTARKTTINE